MGLKYQNILILSLLPPINPGLPYYHGFNTNTASALNLLLPGFVEGGFLQLRNNASIEGNNINNVKGIRKQESKNQTGARICTSHEFIAEQLEKEEKKKQVEEKVTAKVEEGEKEK